MDSDEISHLSNMLFLSWVDRPLFLTLGPKMKLVFSTG